jgi:hypothetical protein
MHYNTDRPHQSLDMAFPADLFRPTPGDGIGLKLPPALTADVPDTSTTDIVLPVPGPQLITASPGLVTALPTLAVAVSRTVPASGNLTVCGQQFWLGPALAGREITLWADTTVVHLMRDGVRLKTVPSRLSLAQLHQLLADDGHPAGLPPISTGPVQPGGSIEVERTINAVGALALGGRQHPVGFHLAGRRVTVRVDHGVLHLLGPDRTALRSLPNPLTTAELARIRDARPAGPPPAHTDDLLRVDRRVSSRGSISIAGQRIHVGIGHAGRTVTVEHTDTTFRIRDGDQLLTEVVRTTTKQIARFKARKPEPLRRRTTVLDEPDDR